MLRALCHTLERKVAQSPVFGCSAASLTVRAMVCTVPHVAGLLHSAPPQRSVWAPSARSFGSIVAASADFKSLGLSKMWVQRLKDLGIETPSATQQAALPTILSGRHAILKAETGTGKTLCYLLPILEDVYARWLSKDATRGVDDGTSPSAAAVIVVPTQELVHQIVNVASLLLPEGKHLFRAVYADKGVTRRDNVACIVATPTALKENVNYHQLATLKFLVLDEIDMLLSGTYYPIVQGYILSIFKQREPERRPQHIFCGATIPSKGKLSPQAFLDKFYPDPEVVRVSTAGAHRSLSSVRQKYVQLDSELPLTIAEKEATRRLKRHADEAAAAAVGPASTSSGSAGRGIRAGEEEAAPEDLIGSAMVSRTSEDHALDIEADQENYFKKLDSLRKHAVMAALVAPISQAVLDRHAKLQAEPSVFASSKRRAGGGSLLLGGAPTPKAERPMLFQPASTEGDEEGPTDHSTAPTEITAFRDEGKLRQTIQPHEAVAIPPTLVFVNSADAAIALRKNILHSSPTLGIGELHRKVSEADRAAQLQRFASGDLRVLVCTDVASRGLDTANVRHVIQADFASDVVTHLHRIGRTARAGKEGIVTNLVTRANLPLVSSLMEALHSGTAVDAAFSRRRSFRKQLKKKAIEQAEEAAIAKELNMDAPA